MNIASIAAASSILVLAGTVQAQTIFSDNFDASTGGLNVVPTDWAVIDGTVDVVSGGFCVSGQCVDLDGSTGDAGLLSRSFSLTGGVLYTLAFDLSGNMRGGSDDVTIGFGSASMSLTSLASNAPYAPYKLDFKPASSATYAISFSNAGGDNVGALLDNVSISVVPEPSTVALMFCGALAVAGFARRRGC